MTKHLIPYDPSQQDKSGEAKPERPSDQVHYHYYDHRTYVQGGDENAPEASDAPDAPAASPWKKITQGLIALLAITALALYFTGPPHAKDRAASFADAQPTSCLGHWSYAPSLEQAMDVYVTSAGDRDYYVAITKMVAGDAENDFQSVATVNMSKDDTTVDGTVSKAILHDAGRKNTLECRTSGAQLTYQGQTRLLKHADADLKSVVAANGWQWPTAAVTTRDLVTKGDGSACAQPDTRTTVIGSIRPERGYPPSVNESDISQIIPVDYTMNMIVAVGVDRSVSAIACEANLTITERGAPGKTFSIRYTLRPSMDGDGGVIVGTSAPEATEYANKVGYRIRDKPSPELDRLFGISPGEKDDTQHGDVPASNSN